MAIDREKLYTTLATRLTDGTEIQVERRFRPISMVPASEQPAMFLVEHEEETEQHMGLPPVHHIRPGLIAYLRLDDDAEEPGPSVNGLLNLLDDALAATEHEHGQHPEAYATTLGGLVTYAWRAGTTVVERGDQGRQIIVYIPLEMLIAE